MNLYFAPLEGITTYIYRNTHNEFFGGCDAYYAPFISPSEQEKVSKKGLRDILPEKNENINLKIQVLTNNSDSFVKFSKLVKELGYDEINVNLGCPASTVVKKGRGSGFLRDPESIDSFFEEIFNSSQAKISAKTRIGYSSPDEMETLMEIYNKYPLTSLIIHPRTREDLYKGTPRLCSFEKAYNISKNKVCYNGDIVTKEDYTNIVDRYPELEGVMIGRGAVRNPALFREIRGGNPITTEELVGFSMKLIENYNKVLDSDTFTLHKLKEVWIYIMENYPEEKKIAKALKKATKLSDFASAIKCLGEIE